jgi:hypothetical protein
LGHLPLLLAAAAQVHILNHLTEHKTLFLVVQVAVVEQHLLAVVQAARLHHQGKVMLVAAVILMAQHTVQVAVAVALLLLVETFLLRVVELVVLVVLVPLHIHLGQVPQVLGFLADTQAVAVAVAELVVLEIAAAVLALVLGKLQLQELLTRVVAVVVELTLAAPVRVTSVLQAAAVLS